MRRVKVLVVVVALAALFGAPSAEAAPISITGMIGFAGAAVPSGAPTWATATGVDFTNPGIVAAASGTYAGVPLLLSSPAVTFTDFAFSPSLSPSPVEPLWTFDYNGITYSFNLNSVFVLSQGVDGNGQSFVTLGGNGILTATGFADTPGSFSFSAQGSAKGNFTFSASNASVPDPGSTLLLLGTGLATLAGARRRWRR